MQPTILAEYSNGNRVPITWADYLIMQWVFPGAITAIYAR